MQILKYQTNLYLNHFIKLNGINLINVIQIKNHFLFKIQKIKNN